jgi:hypothetical protein
MHLKKPAALKVLNVFFNRVADGEILVINYVESTFELLTNILSISIMGDVKKNS